MEANKERMQLVEKLFDQALKMRISRMARKYDPALVFNLWVQIAKIGEVKLDFSRWRWEPDLTITAALDCLDNYCTELESLLRERQIKRRKQI
jgi:hypothetical protein